MQRIPRIGFVVCLLAGEVAALLGLQRLGGVAGFSVPHHRLGEWLLHAPTEDVVAAAARLVGLALAWWLVSATVLSIVRRIVPGWRRLPLLDALSPRVLRHVLDRGLALGLGASIAIGGMHPAGATVTRGPTRAPVTTATRRDQPVPRNPGTPVGPNRAPRPSSPAAPGTRAVAVHAGDNLWLIARRALPPGSGVPAADEIAPYWQRVVAANAATLRSHDPNLIFPGERVLLPPIDDRPAAG